MVGSGDGGETFWVKGECEVGQSKTVSGGHGFSAPSCVAVEVEVEIGGSGNLSGDWWQALAEVRGLGEVCYPGIGCPFPFVHVLSMEQFDGKKGETPCKISLMKLSDMACGAVSRIVPFFEVFGNLPYKVWHYEDGTCEGPLGYFPNMSCASQAQTLGAGKLVPSCLFGDLPFKVWHFSIGPFKGPLGYFPIKSCFLQAQVQCTGMFVSSVLCGESMDGHLTEHMGCSRESPSGSNALAVVVRMGACSITQLVSVQFCTDGSEAFVSHAKVAVLIFRCAGDAQALGHKTVRVMREREVRRRRCQFNFVVMLLIGVFMVCRYGSFCGGFNFPVGFEF